MLDNQKFVELAYFAVRNTCGSQRCMSDNTMTQDRNASSQPSRIGWVVGLTLFALLLGGSATRIVPGGPFISITSDVLPAAASLIAMRFGLVALRGRNVGTKLLALVFILLATLALGRIMIDVYSFWNRPYARGDLLGL